MRAGETLVASDGYEVALFPLEALYIYQDENIGSHIGTYNLDLHGYRYNGSSWVRTYDCPIYAPFTCRLVYQDNSYGAGNMRIFQSTNMVHTPGGLRYICVLFAHAYNPPVSGVGTVCSQGQHIYNTGDYGVSTGDHSHTTAGQGQWVNWSTSMTDRPPDNHQDFTNRVHYWDAFYVNDTEILKGNGHPWLTWTGPTPPTPSGEILKKFPWVLYARKLRNERG